MVLKTKHIKKVYKTLSLLQKMIAKSNDFLKIKVRILTARKDTTYKVSGFLFISSSKVLNLKKREGAYHSRREKSQEQSILGNGESEKTFLENCPPTPPLTQHFALSEK